MTVIVIIGILAAAAVPAYREYVYRAKIAEGYVGVAAINKGQQVYYNEYKAFVEALITPESNGCACTPPAGGTKYTLFIHRNELPTWKMIGVPVTESPNYFSYRTLAFNWDKDGNGPTSVRYDASGTASNVTQNLTSSSFKVPVAVGGALNFNCPSAVSIDSVGIVAAPSFKGVFTHASASFKGVNCTSIVQALTTVNGELRATPMITVQE